MFDVYLIFRSVTHGQAGRAALDRGGIPSRLIRSPRELAPSGCAYALTVRGRDLSRAYRFLLEDGTRPSDCFRREADGSFVRQTP